MVGRAGSTTRWGSIRGSAASARISVRLGFILADDADENAAGAEAGNVARDVARAADGEIIARHRQNRSRRFGRNARDFAVDEIVEHQVSDADDGLLGNELDHFFEVEHRAIAGLLPGRAVTDIGRAGSGT